MFEYAKAVGFGSRDLKNLVMRNVEAIFAKDQETKDWVRGQVTKFTVHD